MMRSLATIFFLCAVAYDSIATAQHDFSDAPELPATIELLGSGQADKPTDKPNNETIFVAPSIDQSVIGANGDLYASQMQLASDTICWYYNTDGSCVQCSIGMTGVHAKDINAACVLFKSPYGKAERGGSYPSRVADYFARRGIKGWNVTGWPQTREWAIWATQTGRFAAIGFFRSHFQTLYAYDPDHKDAKGQVKPWGIMNNWARDNAKIDWYSEADFQTLHLASGPWIVILERPCSDNPEIVQWWR